MTKCEGCPFIKAVESGFDECCEGCDREEREEREETDKNDLTH